MPGLSGHTAAAPQSAYLIAPEKKEIQSLLSKMRQALYRENYPKYIKCLHQLGTSLQESWQLGGRTQESERRQYVVDQVTPRPNDEPITLAELCERASHLEVIFTVWEDPGLLRELGEEKVARQTHKIKREIDIANRRAIHTALFAQVASLIHEIESLDDANANAISVEISELQKIKRDFTVLVGADGKLDNGALVDILKRIKLLNNTVEKAERIDYSKKTTQLLEVSESLDKQDSKKLLGEIFVSIAANEKRNEELLEEILDPMRWRDNERLLEAILYRIDESKQDNKKLLEEIRPNEGVNAELLKKITDRLGENKERNEKLLSTIVDYLSKKEEQNTSALKETAKHVKKNAKLTQKLREKNFKYRKSHPGASSQEYLACIRESEEEAKDLEGINERIKEDKKGNAKLLKKIHSVSEDKKKREKIKKLLDKNSPIPEHIFNAWSPTAETTQESQKLLAGVEAAIKSKKVKKALVSFKTPVGKAISRASFFLSVLAGLSCGIVTGGCIFLLLIGATVGAPLGLGIAVGAFVFIAGFFANFNFFSYAIPEFLLKLAKTGGVTEIIDKDGKRAQLSARKKLLLAPAALLSVAVGVCVGAFTFMSGMQLVAALLPFLAAAAPALPVIIIGALVAAIAIAMSIIMFRAFVGILQKPFSFAQLWKDFVKTLREMTVSKALGYVVKGSIIVFAIFSLYFLCSIGIPTLTIAFGATVAHLFSLASFVGQIPFCAVTISNFCNFVTEWVTEKFFRAEHAPSSKISQELNRPTWSSQGFFSRCFSFMQRIFLPGALSANAVGNGTLVVVPDSPIAPPVSPIMYVAAAGNILISVAGNMVPNGAGEAQERVQADKVIVQDIIKAPKVSTPNDDVRRDLPASGVAPSSPPRSSAAGEGFFCRRKSMPFGREAAAYKQSNDEQAVPCPSCNKGYRGARSP